MSYDLNTELTCVKDCRSINGVYAFINNIFIVISKDMNLNIITLILKDDFINSEHFKFYEKDLYSNFIETVIKNPVIKVSKSSLNKWNGSKTPIPISIHAEELISYATNHNLISSVKCECGCSTIGISKHSDYCPLYSKE